MPNYLTPWYNNHILAKTKEKTKTNTPTHAKFFETLYAKPYLFRRITTFSQEEFNLLANKVEPEWKERELERLIGKKRKNAVGQGRKYELKTFGNLLLATILYLRTTIGYELLGLLLGIYQSTVKRVLRRVAPLLQDRFLPITPRTKKKKRTNNLDEFLKDYPELTDVIFDGTELSINRPKRRQKAAYSGKKKHHTKKSIVARDKRTKLFLGGFSSSKWKDSRQETDGTDRMGSNASQERQTVGRSWILRNGRMEASQQEA